MMIRLNYQFDQQSLENKLTEIRNFGASNFRRRLVQEVLKRTVQRVIDRHPVETGRARDAWGNALLQVGTDGTSNSLHGRDHTSAQVTNEVDYVVFLEKGTRRMRPHLMVSRSLAEVPLYLSQLSEQLFKEEMVTP